MSSFDYDEEGYSIVLGDGRELLVHDGASEAPRWRSESPARLVGVASNSIGIVSLDELGVLTIWSHETATAVKSMNLALPATALASDYLGRCAAVHGGGVVVASGPEPCSFDVAGATCAAFGGDGLLAVGAKTGELTVFDRKGAAPPAVVQLDAAIADVAWNAGGFFFVATAASVYRLDGGELTHVTNAPPGLGIASLACSASGHRLGLQLGDAMALVLAYPSRETEGNVTYGGRTICGMAFGPDDWFGVGMHGGDGNKFDLRTGATHRTDTHPGRTHNRWVLAAAFGEPSAPSPQPAAAQPAAAQPAAAPRAGNGGKKKNPIIALLTMAVFIAIVGAVAYFNHEPTELWLVNGLGVPVTVSVDGQPVELQPESWQMVPAGSGEHDIVVTSGGRELGRETVDVDGEMAVYNVLGAAWVFGDTIWYGGSGDRGWELYAFDTFHDIDEETVHLRFRPVPNSTSSSTGVATYRYVGVGAQWGWRYTLAQAHSRLAPAAAAAFEARLTAAQPTLAATGGK